MLSLRDVESGYGTSRVLHGLSLHVGEGEVVTLMGRNGMGKTTTVRTVMGQLPHLGGETTFRGRAISNCRSSDIARCGIGLVPEGRQIFPNLTVEENLIAASANRSNSASPWSVSRIFDLLPSLAARRQSMGNLLSGGEQQMLAIGRALMINPHLLILDEATEGLAPVVRNVIWATLRQLKELGQAILVIDKNLAAVSKIADRHFVIEKGRVVWQGDGAALAADMDRVSSYLTA
jgi:branched-chain amino acid transport system ATP-binding protein